MAAALTSAIWQRRASLAGLRLSGVGAAAPAADPARRIGADARRRLPDRGARRDLRPGRDRRLPAHVTGFPVAGSARACGRWRSSRSCSRSCSRSSPSPAGSPRASPRPSRCMSEPGSVRDRRLMARAGIALVLANARYWSTVAPLVHAQLRAGSSAREAIPTRAAGAGARQAARASASTSESRRRSRRSRRARTARARRGDRRAAGHVRLPRRAHRAAAGRPHARRAAAVHGLERRAHPGAPGGGTPPSARPASSNSTSATTTATSPRPTTAATWRSSCGRSGSRCRSCPRQPRSPRSRGSAAARCAQAQVLSHAAARAGTTDELERWAGREAAEGRPGHGAGVAGVSRRRGGIGARAARADRRRGRSRARRRADAAADRRGLPLDRRADDARQPDRPRRGPRHGPSWATRSYYDEPGARWRPALAGVVAPRRGRLGTRAARWRAPRR